MINACPSWPSVLAALHDELPGDEGVRARAHLSSCAVCGGLAKAAPAMQRALRGCGAPAERSGDCPAPETLAAYAAGGAGIAVGEAVEAHLADCAACRADVAAAHEDAGHAHAPEPLTARNLARARALVGRAAPRPSRPSNDTLVLPVQATRPRREWGWVVPLSLAAGLLGGMVAARWLVRPAAVPSGASDVAVQPPVSSPSAENWQALARRLDASEARARELAQHLQERAASDDAARTQSRSFGSTLDDMKKRMEAFDASMHSLAALAQSQAGAAAGTAASSAEVQDRLAKIQRELDRAMAQVETMRRTHDAMAQEAEEARQREATQLARIRELEAQAAPADVDAPPNYDEVFAALRQGPPGDYAKAMDKLRSQRLDGLGYVIAYYHKDTPKDRRAQAGDELNRRGPKTVDHELVLAMAHDQLPVRREAAFYLSKYRARVQDFNAYAAAPVDERHRGLLKAMRWWEKEYHAEFPEKAQLQQGVILLAPVANPLNAVPPAAAPGGPAAPPAALPPQYVPPPAAPPQ